MLSGGGGETRARECTFLVVDDDPQWLSSMLREARGRGRAVIASTAEEALGVARREVPEIAIVDYFLGTGFGVDLIEPLRAVKLTMRILIASAGMSTSLVEQALWAGADGVIPKPFDLAFAIRKANEPTATERPEEIKPLAEVEDAHIRRILVACAFNISRTAKYLGINANTLRARMKKAGIPVVPSKKRL